MPFIFHNNILFVLQLQKHSFLSDNAQMIYDLICENKSGNNENTLDFLYWKK